MLLFTKTFQLRLPVRLAIRSRWVATLLVVGLSLNGCGGDDEFESGEDGGGARAQYGAASGSGGETMSGGSTSGGTSASSGGTGVSSSGGAATGGAATGGNMATGDNSGAGGGIAGGFNCNASQVVTDEVAEPCPQSQLRSVIDGHWDECVPLRECGCEQAGQAQCGDGLSYVCYINEKRCGDLVR